MSARENNQSPCPPTIFLTGGSGFLGSSVLEALLKSGRRVVALDRSGSIAKRRGTHPNLATVGADLLDPERYKYAISDTDVVLHLAALTGRGTKSEHFRINAQGTRVLVEQCREVGMGRFVYVSSIATKFEPKTKYYYAQSKAEAENVVRASGLNFAILRLTIVLGRSSPVLGALERLAISPIFFVPGSGGTLVQPVYVDDVVGCLSRIVNDAMLDRQTYDFGGPEALSIEELLRAIRELRMGKRDRPVHVPLGTLKAILYGAERMGLGSLLPFDSGQLTSFEADGSIERNALHDSCVPRLTSVSDALQLSLSS